MSSLSSINLSSINDYNSAPYRYQQGGSMRQTFILPGYSIMVIVVPIDMIYPGIPYRKLR